MGNLAKLSPHSPPMTGTQVMMERQMKPRMGAQRRWNVGARVLLLSHDVHTNPGPLTHTPTLVYIILYVVLLTADVWSVMEGPTVSLSPPTTPPCAVRGGIKNKHVRVHKCQVGRIHLLLFFRCHLGANVPLQDAPSG